MFQTSFQRNKTTSGRTRVVLQKIGEKEIGEIGNVCISRRLSGDFVSFAKWRSKFSGGLIESTRRSQRSAIRFSPAFIGPNVRRSNFPWRRTMSTFRRQNRERKQKACSTTCSRFTVTSRGNCFFIDRRTSRQVECWHVVSCKSAQRKLTCWLSDWLANWLTTSSYGQSAPRYVDLANAAAN